MVMVYYMHQENYWQSRIWDRSSETDTYKRRNKQVASAAKTLNK